MGTRITPPPCPSSSNSNITQHSMPIKTMTTSTAAATTATTATATSTAATLAASSGLTHLIEDLQRLSEDQDSSDVIFICGREEERIYAHRIMLAARCKAFNKVGKRTGEICRIPGCTVLLAVGGSPIQIRLPHVNPEVFKQFILYVYTAKILLQDSRVFEMMTLAQDMGVEELRAACEDHAFSTLSVDNACTFLAAVMDIHEKAGAKCAASFMERCVIYIGEHATECVKTNAFLNLSKDALIKLISSDYFCLEEEEVWRCVLAWAKNHAGVTQPTAHWTEEERARVCQQLSGVMCHVRLLLIDSQVFAEEVEPTGAVPMELSLERYRYAALNSNRAHNGGNINSTAGLSSGGGGGGSTYGSHVPNGSLSHNSTTHANMIHSEEDKRLQPRLTLNMFPGTQILKNDKMSLQSVLNAWYGVPKQTWRLVYRASSHGYSAQAFHRYCDGVAPCFVIAISPIGEISGGFTDVPWSKTHRKGGYIHSERAFLFALNPMSGEGPVKFNILKKPYAICYHADCGPIFGAGADLLISSMCNANEDSYSNLPHSYDGSNASYMTLFGDYNFMIADYEVYTLNSSFTNVPPNDVGINNPTHNYCTPNTSGGVNETSSNSNNNINGNIITNVINSGRTSTLGSVGGTTMNASNSCGIGNGSNVSGSGTAKVKYERY